MVAKNKINSFNQECDHEEVCPDENLLGRYLENLLEEKESEVIEKHLGQCSNCMQQIEIFNEVKSDSEQGTLSSFPYKVRQNAIRLFSLYKTRNTLDIVIEFIKDHWELMKNSGMALATPALVTRGNESESGFIPFFHIKKEFDDCITNAKVENIKDDVFSLRVFVKDKKQKFLLRKVDIKLIDLIRQRKLEEILCDGQAIFEGIKVGAYKIELSQETKELGQIYLVIRK